MVEGDWQTLRDVRLRALSDTPLAFGSTYAREAPLTNVEWQARAKKWTTAGSAAFLAFDQQNACCGIVACYTPPEAAGRIHVVSMWVAPQVRKQSVGRRLLNEIDAWATKHGVSEIMLHVTEGNTPAIECYRRCGYELTGQTIPYPNDPQLREFEMVKKCPAR
jgi:ribosomal protein S18 acetylase RimI-like enzyme